MLIDKIKELVRASEFEGFPKLEARLGAPRNSLSRQLESWINKTNKVLELIGYKLTIKKK